MIELSHVSKTIRRHKVIDDVTVTMEPGVVTGLKGINGSGKTMLMRLISGLIRPTEGTITIAGKVLGKDMTFPESIGILIENPAFLDAYSGFENLKLLSSIQGKITEEEVRESLWRVKLDPDDKRKYRKYSLGMKQRLGIAAAIMEHPRILILDEPTNALDSDGVEIVKEILRQEKERGALIVVSCHDLPALKELSDVIYLMEEGRLTPYEEVEG